LISKLIDIKISYIFSTLSIQSISKFVKKYVCCFRYNRIFYFFNRIGIRYSRNWRVIKFVPYFSYWVLTICCV